MRSMFLVASLMLALSISGETSAANCDATAVDPDQVRDFLRGNGFCAKGVPIVFPLKPSNNAENANLVSDLCDHRQAIVRFDDGNQAAVISCVKK